MDQITDHADRAVERLPALHRSKATMVALARAACVPVQEIENVLFAVLGIASIDSAEGAQLDTIGRVVGQERGTLDDAAYRVWLKARQAANRSSGTIPELLAVIRAVVPADATIVVLDQFPAGLQIQCFGVPIDLHEAVSSLVHVAHAGGVRVVFEFLASPEAATFRLDSGPGLDVGKLAGASE
jgi:hypothetical protein